MAALEPRPSPPPKRGASPPLGTTQPWWQVSPVEPSEEPWQARTGTPPDKEEPEPAHLSLHADHQGRLDQEQHDG
eukprot:scaffold3808_cov112-Isochrysis_galbana.AAC.15